MATYRVVQLSRDRLSGWVVEKVDSGKERRPIPRMLYKTKEQAQAEANRLSALEEKPPG
ncbi:MAG TPA: hypothetical protein VK690_08295 [Stellaceae bacterium]|jgi:hypothetical protein|nr:hypothetical protein [Stellaceae bacterium]